VKPVSRAIGQELLDDTAAMNRGTIPNDDQATSDFPQHMRQEGHHIFRTDGVILAEDQGKSRLLYVEATSERCRIEFTWNRFTAAIAVIVALIAGIAKYWS
jgi:hypothetical protein